jgi:cell division protein FtsZ
VISGDDEVTMDEIGQIIDYVKECSGPHTDLIWGNGNDPNLGSKISATVIATGFNGSNIPELYLRNKDIESIPLLDYTASGQEGNGIFVVRDTSARPQEPHTIPSQRTIEFDLKTVDEDLLRNISRVRKPIDPRKANERVKTIKRTQEDFRELKQYSLPSDEEIDNMENIPAYKRRQLPIDAIKTPDDTKLSRYSLSDDDQSQVKLSKENPYLHGAVD